MGVRGEMNYFRLWGGGKKKKSKQSFGRYARDAACIVNAISSLSSILNVSDAYTLPMSHARRTGTQEATVHPSRPYSKLHARTPREDQFVRAVGLARIEICIPQYPWSVRDAGIIGSTVGKLIGVTSHNAGIP